MIFTGATAMLGFQLFQLLLKYFAFEKRIIVNIRSWEDAASLFPWITVCYWRVFGTVTLNRIYNFFRLTQPREIKSLQIMTTVLCK